MNDAEAISRRVAAPADVPRRAIILLSTAAFSSSVNLRVCDPLLPQVAHDFGASVGSAAAIITAFAVGYGLTQLLFGPIGDRYGKYLIVALTSLATGIATAIAAGMPTLDSLTIARFVVGACAAAPIPLAFAWIGDAVSFERRQAVLARFLSAQFTGIVLGQAVGGYLGDMFGWRSVFYIVAILHTLAGLSMLWELRAHPEDQPPGATSTLRFSSLVSGLLDILKRPWVGVLLTTVFIEAFAFYGSFAYIGADLHHRHGVSFGVVGVLMAFFGAGAICYSLSARRLLARLGERGLVLGGGILLAVALVALGLTPTSAVAPPIMALMGFAFYMLHNTLQTNATQMAPEARGLGVSLFAFALFLGQALGVAVGAPIVDRWGAPPFFIAMGLSLPFIALWFRARLRYRPVS